MKESNLFYRLRYHLTNYPGWRYYVTYPIKILMKSRVEKAKAEFAILEVTNNQVRPKARRSGMTSAVFMISMRNHLRYCKLKRFIEFWDIKNG